MWTTCRPTRSGSIAARLTEPGRDSPYRERSAGGGEPRPVPAHAGRRVQGRRTGAAGPRSTWQSGNIKLRDPVLYRILHAAHPRTGDTWCIYPTYDFAHGQSDAIEGVTHSLCTLEFADHRPLYDWLIKNLPVPSQPLPVRVRPPQHDLHGAVQAAALSSWSRKVMCAGWDDPRMPTLSWH